MKTMTQREAITHAKRLISVHGLAGWTVKIDTARTRAGQCRPARRQISLSSYIMRQRSFEDTYNTITHEIAHALVGAHHGHDAVWQRKHRELGGDGKRCFAHEDKESPYVGRCAHGKEWARYKRVPAGREYRCQCVRGGSPVVFERRK